MSRFVSEQTKKIELEGGDYVEVQSKMSWKEMQDIFLIGADGGASQTAIPMLKKVLKSWSFKDDEDKNVECTPENIEMLDFETVQELIEKVMEIYTPKKK